MNYRHAFHAGNPADVMKHAVLAYLLERLQAKPAPFFVLDTHAGIGRYDLEAQQAQRTGEAIRGVRRLLRENAPSLPAAAAAYLAALRNLNPAGQPLEMLRHYPGSPLLARLAMRPGDRLVLAELHPEDVQTLRANFRGDSQVAIHHMDGWLALKAHLPPPERRGLVVIDPPFEAPDEFERLVAALALAHRRWSTGLYLLWYPIKDRATSWRFHQMLTQTGIPRILAAELTWADDDRSDRLNGSGLILVNPPWQTDEAVGALLPALHAGLGAEAGDGRIFWIRDEAGKPGA